MNNLLQIDGSKGEGGGQILRTSLTMSMVTGIPIQISHIRSGRSKPGLKQQHLACVRAAQAISDATVSGVKQNSQQITFQPKAIKAGEYHFRIGTAGSTTLIFQTILPTLMLADAPSTLHFEGGTHNQWAPSFDFIALAYVPMLKRMGVDVDMTIDSYGFYPQGGGQWSAVIKPISSLKKLEVLERGELLKQEAMVTCCKIPEHVPTRELRRLSQQLDWPKEAFKSQWVHAVGGGNVVSLRLFYEHCSEVIDSIGKVGLPAERVANIAVTLMREYQEAEVPVGEYLADQLLLPMAIAKGGIFRTKNPSLHTLTNRDVIHFFIDKRFEFNELEKGEWEVSF